METTTATKSNTPTASKSINRGTLLRAARKGQLWVKCTMRLTDDYAYDNAANFGKASEFRLVVIDEETLPWSERPNDGCIHFTARDFRYTSGYAAVEKSGKITWGQLAGTYYEALISDN